ncbi:MAG: tetratricopeptide repeat protein [Geothrix sp.]|uniref:tetratricopeptide repeat protein n=1 Tax=Geothrix sp. TaxID=1962974 RepID=UPI00183BB1F1|nr:tetratricopeptide repeat protein [Geothrix sp.]NWJ40465.1 tetratricopeptide repeat protein [Geothrix sp.]WIL21528.1 MAG: tetratricopeptide repeat protein [Geothrix sp.]
MNRLVPSLLVLLSAPLSAGAPPSTAPQKKAEAPVPEAAKAYDAAYAELQKKAYAEALPLYEKALALAPARAEVWNEYAICLRNLRRLPAAARAGWRAIQLDGGKTMQPWNAQANTFIEAREWKAAEHCLEKVEALRGDAPFVARAWLNLAFRMMVAGESAGIVDHCRRAIRLDPGSSLAWIDLGQALACTGGDPKDMAAAFDKGHALAESQKDVQRADYARQLHTKAKAGESIRPPADPGQAWQLLPEALRTLPTEDASRLPLPAVVEHRYTLPEDGVLALSLPETWTEAFDRARPEHLFAARYGVVDQAGFKAFLFPIKGIGNPLGAWSSAEQTVKRLKDSSAETDLKPQPLASTTVQGWWILSTDKKVVDREPAKGEYRHLLTVLFDAKNLQCVGTVLTNSKAPEVVDPCLAAFGSARKIERAVMKK